MMHKFVLTFFMFVVALGVAAQKIDSSYTSPVVRHQISVPAVVKPGQKTKIEIVYKVVASGAVAEELTIFDAKTNKPLRVSKQKVGTEAKLYQNSFKLQLPSKVPTGDYPIKHRVFFNNKVVSTKKGVLKVR